MEIVTLQQLNNLIDRHPLPFFNTPFFRNYLANTTEQYQQEENPFIKETIYGRVYSIIVTANQINKVWSDVPVDYYRTYLSMLESFVQVKFFNEPEVVQWCQENMSYPTFFNLVSQGLDKTDLSVTNNLLRDTFSQIQKVLQRGFNVTRPERWRLKEFHDHVSTIYLEKTTENVPFPEKSIETPYVEGDYKVYQPDDTLTLAKWAAKVRNCVASYADKVFQKQSEIVFVEQGGAAKFTVEIDYGPLKKGNVQIKQIQESCKGMGCTQEQEREHCRRMIERAVGLAR